METRGITIEFYGKSLELENSIKDINKGLRATRDELKSINKDLKLDPTNVDRLKDKFAKLKQQQELLNKSIDLYEKELSKLGKEDIGSEKYVQLQTRLEGAKRSLQTVNDQLSKMEKMNLDNLSNGIEKADNSLKNASSDALTFGDVFKANVISDLVINGLKTLANELKQVADELNQWADDFREAQVYEAQFESNIRNTADASDEEIASLKKLAKQKEKTGVVSAKAITSAYQELATYVESTDAIEGLTDALTDMAAQQYGVDATDDAVRNLATTLGKALANGDYSGLTKLGYGFSEAQQRIMKYGSELQRVKVLNDVISSSIGGMNEALAQTDAGKLFTVKTYFDDIKQSIGGVVSELEIGVVEQLMPTLQPIIDDILQWILDNKDEIFSAVKNTIDYLTSDEMKKFYSDVAEVTKDFMDIVEYIVKIGEDIGLWEGIFTAVKGVVSGIKELFDAIARDVETIKSGGIGNWLKGNYNSYYPGTFESGGYMSSGGMMSSITLNNSFTINNANNIDRATVMSWADVMTERINENLGRMV